MQQPLKPALLCYVYNHPEDRRIMTFEDLTKAFPPGIPPQVLTRDPEAGSLDPLASKVYEGLRNRVQGRDWMSADPGSVAYGHVWLTPEARLHYLPALLRGVLDGHFYCYVKADSNLWSSGIGPGPSGETWKWYFDQLNAEQRRCVYEILAADESRAYGFEGWKGEEGFIDRSHVDRPWNYLPTWAEQAMKRLFEAFPPGVPPSVVIEVPDNLPPSLDQIDDQYIGVHGWLQNFVRGRTWTEVDSVAYEYLWMTPEARLYYLPTLLKGNLEGNEHARQEALSYLETTGSSDFWVWILNRLTPEQHRVVYEILSYDRSQAYVFEGWNPGEDEF